MPSTEFTTGIAPTGEIRRLAAANADEDIVARYDALIAEGRIVEDPAQRLVLAKLKAELAALVGESRKRGPARRFLDRWIGPADRPPRGLYIHGAVGRGKSMLMDLFFAAVPFPEKRRIHFHAFMQDVHDTLHRWRQEMRDQRDLLIVFADRLAGSVRLLCFDEFHVGNIADAMILSRLFAALFDRGLVIVATSNDAPQNLYAGGLQRDRFLPFIDLLTRRMEIVELAGGRDYRLARLGDMRLYHSPLGPMAARAMAESFDRLTDGAAMRPTIFEIHGRKLELPRTAGRVAWLDFDELCRKPLGAADYLAIAGGFDIVLIDNVPILGDEDRDAARRFAILIDALYDRRVGTILAAAAKPDRLYAATQGAREFARTISRLVEMQSLDYRIGAAGR